MLSGVAFLAAPWLVKLITPGFEGAQLERTIELTRLMLLAPMFLALGAVATSALNAHRRFAASALAPIVYDLAIIGAAFLLTPSMGVTGLAIGVVAGSLGHLLVQLPALSRAGFRLTPSFDARDPDVAQALKLMLPRALALGAGQVTFIVATSLASGLDPGSVTAFTFAFTVFSIPLSVIGVPLGIVALPTLSRDLARGAIDEFVELVTRALRMIAFVIGPIVALGVVLREPAATILFNHGRFSEDGVHLVAATLALLLLALPGEALITILVRAFYANRDTRTPATAAILAVVINVAVGVLAVNAFGWGLAGIAFGIALGSTIEAIVLVLVLRREIPAFDPSPVVRVVVPVALASLAAALVAFGTWRFWTARRPGWRSTSARSSSSWSRAGSVPSRTSASRRLCGCRSWASSCGSCPTRCRASGRRDRPHGGAASSQEPRGGTPEEARRRRAYGEEGSSAQGGHRPGAGGGRGRRSPAEALDPVNRWRPLRLSR